jgi:hypothetical protein
LNPSSYLAVTLKPDQVRGVKNTPHKEKSDVGCTAGYLYLAKPIQTTHMADAAKQLLPTPRYVVKRSKI